MICKSLWTCIEFRVNIFAYASISWSSSSLRPIFPSLRFNSPLKGGRGRGNKFRGHKSGGTGNWSLGRTDEVHACSLWTLHRFTLFDMVACVSQERLLHCTCVVVRTSMFSLHVQSNFKYIFSKRNSSRPSVCPKRPRSLLFREYTYGGTPAYEGRWFFWEKERDCVCVCVRERERDLDSVLYCGVVSWEIIVCLHIAPAHHHAGWFASAEGQTNHSSCLHTYWML